MARRGASSARRIEINRAALDAITLAAADGLFNLACDIVTAANVPDAPPIAKGLMQGGGVLAYVGKNKVAQLATGGQTSIRKPRGSSRLKDGTVTVIGGYGFPGRFVEEGTAKMAAEPFLTPELMSRLPDAGPYVAEAVRRRGIVNAARARAGDVYGAKNVPPEARAEVRRIRSAVARGAL